MLGKAPSTSSGLPPASVAVDVAVDDGVVVVVGGGVVPILQQTLVVAVAVAT